MFAYEYGWTVDQFLDTPSMIIQLLYEKMASRHSKATAESLTTLIFGIRAALIRTLLPKRKDQQHSWRKFAQEFAQYYNSLMPQKITTNTTKDYTTEDLVSRGFKKAE